MASMHRLADFVATAEPPCSIDITVRRARGASSDWLFTYAGDVDELAIDAVLHHVKRLTDDVSGKFCVEVLAVGFSQDLLERLRGALSSLRRDGLQPRLTTATAREVVSAGRFVAESAVEHHANSVPR